VITLIIRVAWNFINVIFWSLQTIESKVSLRTIAIATNNNNNRESTLPRYGMTSQNYGSLCVANKNVWIVAKFFFFLNCNNKIRTNSINNVNKIQWISQSRNYHDSFDLKKDFAKRCLKLETLRRYSNENWLTWSKWWQDK